MAYKFRNIINLLQYVKEQNMCTTLFCTTCGAMEFRQMCKNIGKDEIEHLIECVTETDLENMPLAIKRGGWYEPLRILLYDGFTANPYCPMMKWYREGEEVHLATCTKNLILEMGSHKVYGIIGSIFNNSECEVTALFQYNGHATLPVEMYKFLRDYKIPAIHGTLKESGIMPPNVKAIYYAETLQTMGRVKDVEHVIDEALSLLSSKGYQSIAMNGVRTLGYSDLDNLNIVERWFKQHPDSPIHSLHLVDKRGGFNRLADKVITPAIN